MSGDLLLAAAAFCGGMVLISHLILSARIRRSSSAVRGSDAADESRVADLITELNHVANSHVNAVEDRREELKRVIEMANDRVRRLNALLSDLEILEKRMRAHKSAVSEEPSRRSASDGREVDVEAGPTAVHRGHIEVRRELHDRIRTLASAGESPSRIAAQLKVPQSAVEMVIRRM